MSPVHLYLITLIILCCLFSNTSGRYHEWWQRDEDTIKTRIRQEEAQISLTHIVEHSHNDNGNYHERNSHKNDDSSDTESGHDARLETTTVVVVVRNDGDGSAVCGGQICLGTGAYCCRLSHGSYGCCWTTYVYQLWWFWMIWVLLFFLILACSLVCWRRRRARFRYVVMANSQYPNYGTSVHTASNSTLPAQPQGYPYPTAPVSPPVYSASEKPPAYGT